MNNYGFVKCGAATPKLKIANPNYNVEEIKKMIKEAENKNTQILVFPELCITGYTCGDLFNQKLLLDKALEGLYTLIKDTSEIDVLTFVGLPLSIRGSLYNCAVGFYKGQIKGIVPKTYIANYNEFYEKRWFESGSTITNLLSEIELFGEKYPFGNVLFENDLIGYKVGVEICEDLWAPIPQSSYLALNGANIIVNLSASNELVAKSDYRRELVTHQSAKIMSGYIYSSCGVHESTTDVVYGGDCIISENGNKLNESIRFQRDNNIIYSDIDIEKISFVRKLNRSFSDNINSINKDSYQHIKISQEPYEVSIDNLDRKIYHKPFVPSSSEVINERCEEIFNIQVAGLSKRLEHTGIKRAVIGISGGLDSTLALLVTKQAFDLLNIPSENIIGITMPGFGTTKNTHNNAMDLMKNMNLSVEEIDIKEACLKHFQDIGHDPDILDVTYENVQARERTQILMDVANKKGGLVIGTGDLSELALGWATYNGDHMSMYAVNSSIPKTLVKFLVGWVADNKETDIVKEILHKILDTPISPELLPPDKEDKITQKTEDIIGPYELHDFFLYYTIREGLTPKKMLFMTQVAFKNRYSKEEIKKYLKLFYKRFFTQQFKRSCMPDGPKVGSVCLSPRGDWRMPSDSDYEIWISELEK